MHNVIIGLQLLCATRACSTNTVNQDVTHLVRIDRTSAPTVLKEHALKVVLVQQVKPLAQQAPAYRMTRVCAISIIASIRTDSGNRELTKTGKLVGLVARGIRLVFLA